VPAVKKNWIYEIKSPLILQPGPAALTDRLDKLVQIFDLYDHDKHNLVY
jgi:iron complex transport system substrate-binding protein